MMTTDHVATPYGITVAAQRLFGAAGARSTAVRKSYSAEKPVVWRSSLLKHADAQGQCFDES